MRDLADKTREQIRRTCAELADAQRHDGPDDEDSLLRDLADKAWSRLSYEIPRAHNGTWSGGAASHLTDLVRIMRLIGPTPIGAVPVDVVACGLYAAVLAAAGMRCPDSDTRAADVLERAQRYMGEQRVTP